MTNDSLPVNLPEPAHHLSHRFYWTIGVIVAAALVAIVIAQNWSDVQTPVLFMTVSMPRGLFMALLLVAGFVLGEWAAHCSIGRKSSRT